MLPQEVALNLRNSAKGPAGAARSLILDAGDITAVPVDVHHSWGRIGVGVGGAADGARYANVGFLSGLVLNLLERFGLVAEMLGRKLLHCIVDEGSFSVGGGSSVLSV